MRMPKTRDEINPIISVGGMLIGFIMLLSGAIYHSMNNQTPLVLLSYILGGFFLCVGTIWLIVVMCEEYFDIDWLTEKADDQ